MFPVRALTVGKDYDWDKKLLTDKQIERIRITLWEARQKSKRRMFSRSLPYYTAAHNQLIQWLCTRLNKLLDEAIRDRLIIGYRNFLTDVS